jgi:hypothetical protein
MKQVPCLGPTVLESSVNIAVNWHFLLSACELKQIFLCNKTTMLIMLKILCDTIQKFVEQVPHIRALFI